MALRPVMSQETAATISSTPLASSYVSKPQRVLACTRCQLRKIKCDRKHPCENCIRAQTQCVPVSQLARPRKRRFPERELLDRLRKYEELLRKHKINFEPLHGDTLGDKESLSHKGSCDSDGEQPANEESGQLSPSTVASSETRNRPRNMWRAMKQESRDSDNSSDSSDDDLRAQLVDNSWQQLFENDENLLFGFRTTIDISTLHPGPAQIFRLWQVYLDNVDPLLKITHTPSLQGRIIEAAGNIFNITPALEALLFSIYCISVLSLTEKECLSMFDSPRADLLKKYQVGCQQALSNCGFLRSSDRESLTALYLYLISVRPSTVPKSLSSVLGLAVRIAQRLGMHSEAGLAKCAPLEAEMRRRLWWSLAIFDTRIGEMSDFKAVTLNPSWDCEIPLNVNDCDMREEMKEQPQPLDKCSEALFVVMRSKLADFLRSSEFHLGFTNLTLKAATKDDVQRSTNRLNGLFKLEQLVEDKYLSVCDPAIPLHFLTIWTARILLARWHLFDYYFRYDSPTAPPSEAQRASAFTYALRMLEGDTKIMTSPLTKRFLWQIQYHFQLPAYVQIAQSLKKRPMSNDAELAWEVMSDNYEVRHDFAEQAHGPLLRLFANILFQAWDAREAALKQSGEPTEPPRIILVLRQQVAQGAAQIPSISDEATTHGKASPNTFGTTMPMNLDNENILFGAAGGQPNYPAMGQPGPYPSLPGLTPPFMDFSQMDWSAMSWNFVNTPPYL